METTLYWTGMWTSVLLSGMLFLSLLLEFFKRNLPLAFGLIVTLSTIYGLTPYSEEAREVWLPISKIPVDVAQAIHGLVAPSEQTTLVNHPS